MSVTIQSGAVYTTEQLHNPITELILSGFESKFTHQLFTKEETFQIAITLSLYLVSEKRENLLIAEKNKKISGCLYSITRDDNYLLLSSYFKQSFPLKKRLKIWLLLGFLSHTPKSNEQHIDFIAVSPAFRGLGIGRKLVQCCKDSSFKNNLTLHVASKNINAYDLYLSEDFYVSTNLSSVIGWKITGIRDWKLMRYEKKYSS